MMNPGNTKLTSARAFIRSLNILLKYARLYSFDHTRTAEQFETAWTELHGAIPVTNESGLLLSATGSQLLLDGAPIDASPAERSFAQLLSAAGLASIQFTSNVTKDDLEKLVRAFPTQNTKPTVLAERLKAALSGVHGIRINEIRYVAEDSSATEVRMAGLLTAQTLGSDTNAMKDWLRDPQKLLQLIAASEGSRSGPGSGPGDGPGSGPGEGPGNGPGTGGDGSGGGLAVDSEGTGGGAGTGTAGAGGSSAGATGGSEVTGGRVAGGSGIGVLGIGWSSAPSGGTGAPGTGTGAPGGGTAAGGSGSAGTAGSGPAVAGDSGGAGGRVTAGSGIGPLGIGWSSGSGGGTGSGSSGGNGGSGVGGGSQQQTGVQVGASSGLGVSGSGGTGKGGTGSGGIGGGVVGTGAGGAGTGTGVHGTGSGSSNGTASGGSGAQGGSSGRSRGQQRGAGHGSGAPGAATGAGSGSGSSGGGTGRPNDTGGFSAWSTKDEDILGILKLLTHLGHAVTGEGAVQPGPLQEELTKLPAQSQDMLRQALAAVAAKAPATNSKDPMLLRLAEHLAVKFALERYERGEVKVNAVRQMIERMSQEIEGLRKILGSHEEKLAQAGVVVESSADMLDRQFWAAVPEKGKRAVLGSPDAWCIPPRNIRQYVVELVSRGEENTALSILQNYASCIENTDIEARRRTATGLADLADVYALIHGKPLAPAIQIVGAQLSVERDDNLQGMISAAFVRLVQEAGTKRVFPAMLQALDTLDAVENQRPVFGQGLRPRIGLEKRVPEFLEDVIRGEHDLDGLAGLLQRFPRIAAENMVLRFNRTGNRIEMQRLVDLAHQTGNELIACLRDTLRGGSANEAAETTALLSRLDSQSVERWLPERVTDWPRQAQDRMVRLLAMGGAPERGNLLVSLLHLIDPVLLSLTIDEIGLSEDAGCVPVLLRLAEGDMSRGGGNFVRLKAMEALGRLKAEQAVDLLRHIAEERHMFRWTYPSELRLAAVQSLAKIDPRWADEFIPHSGFSASDLTLAPLDPLPNAKYFRRRRYPRVRLADPVSATATSGADSYRLEIRGLSLSGGIAVGEKHLQPGTLVSMKFGSSLRPIRAQVLMRDARTQGLGFEIADMDLDERARLRKLLLENKSSAISSEQEVLAEPVV